MASWPQMNIWSYKQRWRNLVNWNTFEERMEIWWGGRPSRNSWERICWLAGRRMFGRRCHPGWRWPSQTETPAPVGAHWRGTRWRWRTWKRRRRWSGGAPSADCCPSASDSTPRSAASSASSSRSLTRSPGAAFLFARSFLEKDYAGPVL